MTTPARAAFPGVTTRQVAGVVVLDCSPPPLAAHELSYSPSVGARRHCGVESVAKASVTEVVGVAESPRTVKAVEVS